MSLSGYFKIGDTYSPVGVTAYRLEKFMPKLPITEITYDNVTGEVDKHGWMHVNNLQYPVSQKDLDALHERLPRFCSGMGELFLQTKVL